MHLRFCLWLKLKKSFSVPLCYELYIVTHELITYEVMTDAMLLLMNALIQYVVIVQFFGHVFLAINGDNSETEEFMFRKLSVLHRIIGFAFGPAVKEFVCFFCYTVFLLSFKVCWNYQFAVLNFFYFLKWDSTLSD